MKIITNAIALMLVIAFAIAASAHFVSTMIIPMYS
jgi:hypothetical protein